MPGDCLIEHGKRFLEPALVPLDQSLVVQRVTEITGEFRQSGMLASEPFVDGERLIVRSDRLGGMTHRSLYHADGVVRFREAASKLGDRRVVAGQSVQNLDGRLR